MTTGKHFYERMVGVFGVFMIFCTTAYGGEKPDVVRDLSPNVNCAVAFQPDTTRILHNPLTGWVLYANIGMDAVDFWKRYDNMYVPALGHNVSVSTYAHTLYIRASWADFNPQEDVYGWRTESNLKAYIEGAYQRNMRLAFRVVVDSRDKGKEFSPQFVKDAGAKGFVNRGKWSPYADDPVFQKYYAKFVKALAADFNDPTKMEFIDGFGLGKWGEYHTMIYSTGDESPKRAVFDWVTDLYSKAFDRVPVVVNYHRWVGAGKDWVDDAHFAADSEEMLDGAIKKGYSLRHDAFGMTTYYGSWERRYAEKIRHRVPIIMEGGWIVRTHRYWQDPRGYRQGVHEDVRRGEFEDSKEAYVNMMDFRFGETESWFRDAYDLVQRFLREGGYRLYPSEISLPSEVRSTSAPVIQHRWENVGWGYCPTNIPQWNQKYKVAFALLDPKTNKVRYIFVDEKTDLSRWIKGTTTEYTLKPQMNHVRKGDYIWAVGLIDQTNNDQIGLQMAVRGDILDSGWLKLVQVKVND